MKDHNEPEVDEDPVVMYLIVHESLNMGMGKTAAQCAHASQMLMMKFNAIEVALDTIEQLDNTFGSLTANEIREWDLKHPKHLIFNEWLASSYRKVVLRASDKDWAKLKEEFKDSMVLVIDAGLTEIAAGSETVIGLWPLRKSNVSKTVKRLQVLK